MSVTPRYLSQSGTQGATVRLQPRPDQSADSGTLFVTLHSAQQQLESVKREKSELLRQCSLLAERVSMLEIAVAKANRFANYDELTGLPNRRLLLDRFALASALAKRHRHSLALLFFDINDFKTVNDKLGHETGDKLLQQVASRLSNSIRESDTACRYGGDEFVILLTEINSHEHAAAMLQNIRSRLAPPYGIDRHSLRLTASVGLAIYPQEAQRFTDLLRLADRSMFSNKSGIRGRSGHTTHESHSAEIHENNGARGR